MNNENENISKLKEKIEDIENKISKKSKLMWTDKEGKLQSLQTRRYENARTYLNDLIKNHIGQSGIPKGLRNDFKKGFKITSGKDKQSKSVKKSISKLITTDDTAFSTN